MSRFESKRASADNHPEEVEMTGHEARALRLLVGEIRDAEPPELDWDRVEQSLNERLAHERAATQRRHKRTGSSWGPLAGFAAAAAALIMIVAQGSQQQLATSTAAAPRTVDVSTLAPLKSRPGELPTYDAADVGTAAMVSSGTEPLRFEVKGVATWVLEPNSRAVVRGAQAPYLVELQQGALHAEVVPRKSTAEVLETFAVEVAGTRVAVHGTVFTVRHRGDDMSVEVTRGAVTVGPGGHRGITTGHLLVGPAHAAFSLDGARQARMLPMPQQPVAVAMVPGNAHDLPSQPHAGVEQPAKDSAEPSAAELAQDSGHAKAPRAAAEPSQAEPVAVAEGPTKEDPAADTAEQPDSQPDAQPEQPEKPAGPKPISASAAQALVVGCLSQVMNSNVSDDTVLMVSSRLSINLSSEGDVQSVRFNPPLRPSLQQRCAGVLWGKKIQGGPQVSFDVRVSRRR